VAVDGKSIKRSCENVSSLAHLSSDVGSAIGWDGTIVLEGKANGEWKVKELAGAPALD
jgi:hypothetical protein